MADMTDAYKIALEVAGQEEAERLGASISLLQQKLKALYAQFKGTPDEFARSVEADTSRLADLRGQLDQITGAERRAAEATKQAARDQTQARRQAAQAAKDQAAAAKQAARDEAQAARQAADTIVDAAHEEMAARKAAQATTVVGVGAGPVRRAGPDRAAAKARLGLAGANMLQDTIQGGSPAYAINNILGLANDGGIKALLGEFVEGAGGMTALIGKASAAGAAFAGLFAVVDAGLKNAKLEWSDLDDVVGELAPVRAAKEAWAGFADLARTSGLSDIADAVNESISSTVGELAEATVGWNSATAAAKANKDAVAGTVATVQAYAAAVQALAKVRSKAQEDQEDRGELFGEAFADVGGAGGFDKVLDRMAEMETMRTGGEKVSVPKLDDKGQPTGKDETITRRDQARRRLETDLARAQAGDNNAMNRLIAQARTAGIDVSGLEGAARGVDARQDAKDLAKARDKAADDAAGEGYDAVDSAIDETHKRAADLAKPLQERFNLSTATGTVVTENMVKGKLAAAGVDKGEADRVAGLVLEDLERQYGKEIEERALKLNTDKAGARQSVTDDAILGAQRDQTEARRALGLDKEQRSPQVYNSSSELRDSIQTRIGEKDDTPRLTLEQQRQANEKLDKSNELLMRLLNKPNVAVCG